jgi:hypothetical protein
LRQIGRKVPNDKKKQKGGKYKAASLKKKLNGRGRNPSKKGKDNRLEKRGPTMKQLFTCTRKVYKRAKSKILSAQTCYRDDHSSVEYSIYKGRRNFVARRSVIHNNSDHV